MTSTTEGTSRTAHLLALMKKGDDAFNARDFAAVDEVHHPDMIAYIPGLAEPVYGKEAHAAAMQQFLRIFPDMHVNSDPSPIQFGAGDWITVITTATGTFTGQMTLPDGTVIPPPERPSTSSSARPPNGTATSSSSSPPSTTPPSSASRSASLSPSEACWPADSSTPGCARSPPPRARRDRGTAHHLAQLGHQRADQTIVDRPRSLLRSGLWICECRSRRSWWICRQDRCWRAG